MVAIEGREFRCQTTYRLPDLEAVEMPRCTFVECQWPAQQTLEARPTLRRVNLTRCHLPASDLRSAPQEGRTGNRHLNVALHRIAITQLQREGPAKTYLEHRRANGDTKAEAIRALLRRISEVFRRMRHVEAAGAAGPSGLAAAA